MTQKNKKILLLLLLFIIFSQSLSQNIEVMKDSLLKEISKIQCKNDAFYADGLFPTKRNNKDDNNIFFSTLVAYTLQNNKDFFTQKQQIIIDSIIQKIQQNFSHYQSRNGRITYNFWQTNPIEMPLPNSKIFSKWNRALLADDLDDTALIYLIKNDKKSDSLVKKEMEKYTHHKSKKLKNIPKEYRNFEAYYTWFGNNQDLDICVIANVLLFVFEKNLALSHYDYQSFELIKTMIENNDHFNNPHLISGWYKTTPIILYSISRMLEKAPQEFQLQLKERIITDIKLSLQNTKNEMETVILFSSLLRLGEKTPYFEKSTTENFPFFYSNFFIGYPIGVRKLTGKGSFHQYKSEAFSQALLLEYWCLSQKKQ